MLRWLSQYPRCYRSSEKRLMIPAGASETLAPIISTASANKNSNSNIILCYYYFPCPLVEICIST